MKGGGVLLYVGQLGWAGWCSVWVYREGVFEDGGSSGKYKHFLWKSKKEFLPLSVIRS